MANWSEESALQLIDMYKTHRVLWDPRDINYFKKDLKEDAWKEIATSAGQTEDVCKSKIISLLASYRRERSKEKKSKVTGKGKTLF
jgi:hypothetical protein